MLDGLDTHIQETRALSQGGSSSTRAPRGPDRLKLSGASPGADSNVAKIALGLTNN